MTPQHPRTILLAAIAASLAGCGSMRADFPSLLPRPIESRSDAIVTEPAPVATPDAALDARIAGVRDRLTAADRAFESAADRAVGLARAAGGSGSDSWLAAQVALAELDTLRTPASTILSELEAIVGDRGIAGQPPYPALDAAIAEARRVATAQQDRIAAIEATLAPA